MELVGYIWDFRSAIVEECSFLWYEAVQIGT